MCEQCWKSEKEERQLRSKLKNTTSCVCSFLLLVVSVCWPPSHFVYLAVSPLNCISVLMAPGFSCPPFDWYLCSRWCKWPIFYFLDEFIKPCQAANFFVASCTLCYQWLVQRALPQDNSNRTHQSNTGIKLLSFIFPWFTSWSLVCPTGWPSFQSRSFRNRSICHCYLFLSFPSVL